MIVIMTRAIVMVISPNALRNSSRLSKQIVFSLLHCTILVALPGRAESAHRNSEKISGKTL
jgi:hypothetical protein